MSEQDDYDYSEQCPHCEDGVIMACVNDICRGCGYCFSNIPNCNGWQICNICKGSGVLPA